jgi:hypothetical protein
MNETDLIERLRTGKSEETSLTERKPESVKPAELRRTASAFANSLAEGQEAVLFVGLDDKSGEPTGIQNMDALQRRIHDALKVDCYPPIAYSTHAVRFEDQPVLAVIIPASTRKPHFTGPAFVREGAQTRVASPEAFEELLLSRIDKCREILRHKNQGLVTVQCIDYKLGSNKPVRTPWVGHSECFIRGCTAHLVTLEEPATGRTYREPLKGIDISYDDTRQRLMLIARFPGLGG